LRSAAGCSPGEGGKDWAGSDQWAEAGNGQRADANEPAECAAEDGARAGAGGGAFRGFGGIFVAEITHAGAIGRENRDIAGREAAGLQASGNADGLGIGRGNGVNARGHFEAPLGLFYKQ
jgi:hypothetical protein